MNELSLLLVEDNILNQKLIFLNLSKYGFVIDVAHNGFEAVEKFKERKYHLILMDVMMPVLDGMEATKQIREIERDKGGHTFIIGLTANTYDADKEKCLVAGMDAFMNKPFDFEVLKGIFNELGINYNK
ncbi:MAG: response regulator [Cytophagaceae bacterium]|nr:response regulator [Cytophagaceae bacterium]